MKRILNILPLDLELNPTDAGNIQNLCEGVHSAVPLLRISLDKTSLEGIEPKTFLYKLVSVDSRLWKQVITFDSASNPLMTFNVVDTWRLSEFSSQRTLRNAFIALVAKYPTLEKLSYDFVA